VKIVVTGATGFIGRAVVRALVARGDVVTALSRAPQRDAFGSGVSVARFDPDAPPDPAPFEGADAVIHLAGESVAGRWTPEKKRAIKDSRESGTRALVASLAACSSRPRALVSASAVGYYGDRGDEPLLESSTPGTGFLAEVCVAWEREIAAAQRLGVRVAWLRQGIVLGAGGGALAAMLPPFRAFAGGPLGNGSQWMPWIHIDDDVALLLFALDRDISGPLNAVSPDIATNARFSQALGAALRRPSLAFAPGIALHALLGEFASSLLASQLVLPDRALEAGFTFAHEMLEEALLDILAPDDHRESATQRFEDSVVVNAPHERVFAFFADASNLARITPPELRFRMLTPSPIEMRRGTVIEYSVAVRGVPMRWKSLIVDWQPGARFVDYQVRGPYLLWRHEHRFAADPAGVRVTDRIVYSLPLAPLSGLALPFVRADIARIFAFRRSAVESALKSAGLHR
jgi:uncharacterized protein (TIGR01777 family)